MKVRPDLAPHGRPAPLRTTPTAWLAVAGRRRGTALLLLALTAALAVPPPARAAGVPAAGGARAAAVAAGPRVGSRYAVLVDAGSGEVLWARNPHVPRPPASLTKMLTVLVAHASLAQRQVAVAGRDAATRPATRLSLKPGQKILVEQALAAALIVSANDMAVLLADTAAGSVPRFSKAMDAESRRLGLRRSRWRVPDGLDAPGHVSSAYDLSILARAVLRDPWLARMVRTRRLAFVTPDGHRHTLSAHSNFLRDYPGAVGVKTGFTDAAGRCLAAAATRGGRTLIAVVLRSPDPPGDAAQMMNWGFGAGRAVRSGLRLPPYTPPADVDALLVPPRPAAAAAQASPAGAALEPPAGSAAGGGRAPLTVALTSAVVLLVGTGSVATALRRRRTSH
jgi:D-alanyl-D-alanine carboxypeptidase (penicillin-binding protein 5/6)